MLSARLQPLTTTALSLVLVPRGTFSDKQRPYRMAIKNVDASISVYLGGSDVTSAGANAYELVAGEPISIDLYAGEVLYAVAASGTPSIRILEIDRGT